MRKRILCGAGEVGKFALSMYGEENVECFYDRNNTIEIYCGKEVIHEIDQLKRMQDEYCITITVAGANAYSMLDSFRKHNIKATWIILELNTIHIYGKYPDCTYEYVLGRKESEYTVCMLKDMFKLYTKKYQNKNLDFWIYTGDYAHDAFEIKNLLNIDVIFSYNTIYTEKGVIAIPDYMCYKSGIFNAYNNVQHEKPYSSFGLLRELGKNDYEDERAFWGGV